RLSGSGRSSSSTATSADSSCAMIRARTWWSSNLSRTALRGCPESGSRTTWYAVSARCRETAKAVPGSPSKLATATTMSLLRGPADSGGEGGLPAGLHHQNAGLGIDGNAEAHFERLDRKPVGLRVVECLVQIPAEFPGNLGNALGDLLRPLDEILGL